MKRPAAASTMTEPMSASATGETLRSLTAAAHWNGRPAADQLVREHDRWLRSVIYGITGRAELVDDVAQQVWLQVCQRLDSLKAPDRQRSWLYAIARNAALDLSRAQRRLQQRTNSLETVPEPDGGARGASPVGSVLRGELQERLLRAISALPALYREPFALRHLEGWSYAEIGELLELPIETVETRLVRARRLLQEMLKGVAL